MYKLKLNAMQCVSCGICNDVCPSAAIDMRFFKGPTLEGARLYSLTYASISNCEKKPEQTLTFPFLVLAELCDGCLVCVYECPTCAIDINKTSYQ